MPAFRYELPVRFGDVDNAGIVYYPNFFHYFHQAFEELFGDGEYARILRERRVGFPAVHVETDFRRPLRYGERPVISVECDEIGTSSVTFHYVIATDAPCAEARITCATIDLDTFRTIPVPDDLRRLFETLH